jgi:hypothetical protein
MYDENEYRVVYCLWVRYLLQIISLIFSVLLQHVDFMCDSLAADLFFSTFTDGPAEDIRDYRPPRFLPVLGRLWGIASHQSFFTAAPMRDATSYTQREPPTSNNSPRIDCHRRKYGKIDDTPFIIRPHVGGKTQPLFPDSTHIAIVLTSAPCAPRGGGGGAAR